MADRPSGASAPRLVLLVDQGVSADLRETCLELARVLAAQSAEPVALVTGPGERLAAAVEAVTRRGAGEARVVDPPPPAPAMGAAPFLWRPDGRPDWAAMWTTFCELALHGGPPHRGAETRIRPDAAGGWPRPELLAELRRGIWETTGLYAERDAAGWLAVTCASPRMAAWLCAAIILENVDARSDEERLLLPAGPGFELGDQVKSLITVLAKTHHYWEAHVAGSASSEAPA